MTNRNWSDVTIYMDIDRPCPRCGHKVGTDEHRPNDGRSCLVTQRPGSR